MPSTLPGFHPAPQALVMTLLGAYIQPREQTGVSSGGLVSLLGEFGFSPGAARVALNRMVGRELLIPRKQGRCVHYQLTPRTVAVLAEGDRRIFTLGRAPSGADTWTVLWHSIPMDQRTARARLVRRLRFLGFGSAQDGTWIAAHDREHDLRALLAELDVAEHVGVMLGRPATTMDFASFATRVWDLVDLASRYRDFVAQFSDFRSGVGDDRQALLMGTRLVHTFREFPFLDPELPEDLVPPPAHRAEAIRLFHDLYPELVPGGRRYFHEVTTP
jgi:phenylacetic acid degradation operon negative regulatory protein